MFNASDRNPFLRIGRDGPLLTIVLHTASFAEGILAGDPETERLLRLSELGRVRLICTPTEDRNIHERVHRVHGAVGEFRADDEWVHITTPLPAETRYRVRHLGDWRRPAEPGSRVTVLDELFVNPPLVDLFIVGEGDPYLVDPARRDHCVSPREAFDLVRVLHSALPQDHGYYYQYRQAKLFPSADLARAAMNMARDHGFPPALEVQVNSFRQRMDLLLRAADAVGRHTLGPRDGHAAGQVSYHLAFFFMLVTGLYDELAWTASLQHSINVKPINVGLRRTEFLRAVKLANPDLAAFLAEPATERVIELFYPARNQVQHRTLLPARVEEAQARVVAELPEETVAHLDAMPEPEEWGVVDRASRSVDPYRFTLAATHAVAGVANGVLTRLNWPQWLNALPEEEREAKRDWFTVDIGLAFHDRLHQHHKPPPYF